MISIEQAIELICQSAHALPREPASLAFAVGRFLASDVHADIDSPPYPKSVMDGFAVRSADVTGMGTQLRVTQTIVAGSVPVRQVEPGTAARIMTGAPMPEGADAVVMVEQTEVHSSDDGELVELKVESVDPGRHWMPAGQNFRKGDLMFRIGHRIRPADIGLLAEVGQSRPQVFRAPRTTILPTGDELVPPSEVPGAGQIRNSNGPMLAALLQSFGCDVALQEPVGDQPDTLRDRIEGALQSDLVVLSGGVSAGMLDLVPKVLTDLGVREVFHKVAIKPGKPIWFGVRDNKDHRTLVFGLPGNPVSGLMGVHRFVRAAIGRMMGTNGDWPQQAAILENDHSVRGGRPTYWPGRMVHDGAERKVRALQWNGSSDLRSLSAADVMIYFPADRLDARAGDVVSVHPLEAWPVFNQIALGD